MNTKLFPITSEQASLVAQRRAEVKQAMQRAQDTLDGMTIGRIEGQFKLKEVILDPPHLVLEVYDESKD